jgi:hypothetical protein
MKVTMNGFIHWKKGYKSPDFHFWTWEDMTSSGYVLVGPCSFECEIPDDFNPVPGQVAALEKEKAKVRHEFNQRIAQLNEQIGKLQALTFDEVKP